MNKTNLEKTLRAINLAETTGPGGQRRARGVSVGAIKSIAAACHGDVRSAVHNLQFQSVGSRGEGKQHLQALSHAEVRSLIHSPFAAGARGGGHAKRSKAAGSSAKADSGESGGGARDTQLDMFHALGKLLYNKRLEPSDPKQMAPERAAHYASVEDQVRSDLRRPPQQAQPERVVEQYGVDWSQLCGQLHQNYLGFFTLSDQAAVAAEGLSDGALIGGWHEERSAREMSAELAASASVRALRWANTAPATATYRQFHGAVSAFAQAEAEAAQWRGADTYLESREGLGTAAHAPRPRAT